MNRTAAYSDVERSGVDSLVREYLPLVKKIALHLSAKLPDGIELDDLMQVGLMGLLEAREAHDNSQGASFSTYAGIRIKGAMLDELRSRDWLPRSVQSKIRKLSLAIDSASRRLGRAASDTDIAEELQVSLAEYHQMAADVACARMINLDDHFDMADTDENNPIEKIEHAGFRAALKQAVTDLPEKEALMMSLYYSEELNLKEIGLILGVSESRVSQIHGQAVARLRTTLAAWKG